MSGVKKKRNWVLIVSVSIGALLALWMVARATKVLEMYHVPTSSNLPDIKPGQIVWASNLKKIERGVYITFLTFDSLQQNEATWIHRCVGVPGDELEMKDGVLYVNGENFDKDYKLQQEYVLTTNRIAEYEALKDFKEEEMYALSENQYILQLSGQKLNEIKSELSKEDSVNQRIADIVEPQLYFFKMGQQKWTVDNFGPITILPDSYFVMGDNRHSAMDSRYLGFIKKEKITGVVLNK